MQRGFIELHIICQPVWREDSFKLNQQTLHTSVSKRQRDVPEKYLNFKTQKSCDVMSVNCSQPAHVCQHHVLLNITVPWEKLLFGSFYLVCKCNVAVVPLSPYWDVFLCCSPPLATSELGAWGKRRWNVMSKMQMHADMWCRKHVLCNSGNLDILQSQMSMSANTVGQLSGYLKRRYKKQVGVTSQAAGTVSVQLSGQVLPLLWVLSCFPSAWLSEWDAVKVGWTEVPPSSIRPTLSLCVIRLVRELPNSHSFNHQQPTQSYAHSTSNVGSVAVNGMTVCQSVQSGASHWNLIFTLKSLRAHSCPNDSIQLWLYATVMNIAQCC